MKAAVYRSYGPPDVLEIVEVDKPVPKDNEVLIKIHATTVTSGDVRMRGLIIPFPFKLPMRMFLGYNTPKQPILGVDLAGEVEAIGKDVTKFNVGDKVFGSAYGTGTGTYAQYISVPEEAVIATMPSNLDYEQSAPIFFGAHTALHFLRAGEVKEGDKVVIYGASGSLGTYAVQIAKHLGAHVTGVCSTANVELVKSLGADKVIDYTKEDFTKSGEKYDAIFDTVGKSPFADSVRCLKRG
ncbi:MAG: NAD(P)-dependent alcohol dehydrogenase, partial [Nitrospirota bacterium]